MWLYLIIAIPFLFLIGTVYNAIKEQKRLENGQLKKILKERADKLKKDPKSIKPYDDKDDERW